MDFLRFLTLNIHIFLYQFECLKPLALVSFGFPSCLPIVTLWLQTRLRLLMGERFEVGGLRWGRLDPLAGLFVRIHHYCGPALKAWHPPNAHPLQSPRQVCQVQTAVGGCFAAYKFKINYSWLSFQATPGTCTFSQLLGFNGTKFQNEFHLISGPSCSSANATNGYK